MNKYMYIMFTRYLLQVNLIMSLIITVVLLLKLNLASP